MFQKVLLIGILFLLSNVSISQIKENELSYAEAYSAARYFFPANISDVDWRMFNYTQVENKLIEDSNTIENFSQIFSSISPLIEFSLDSNFKDDSRSIINPVYWQHYGFGKKNGTFYKSCLVPVDSINYLYNGLQYIERIQGKYDSLEVELKISHATVLNFSNNFLAYGWKTGRQIIKKEDIHFNKEKNVYYCRLRESVEDIYFRYFLEGEYGIDFGIEEITISGYSDNNEQLIFHQDFSDPIVDELQLGNHHSVDVKVDDKGVLNFKSNDKIAFHQIYEENSKSKNQYFTKRLSNGIYMHFPMIIEKHQIIDTISYQKAVYSNMNFPVIAKSNLIDAYGQLLHFHPYFNATEQKFHELFSNLYQNADTCLSIGSVGKLIRSLMFPVKDAHMYVYNGAIPSPKKFVGIEVEFIGEKCFVKNSLISQIESGDRIISFQGQSPWVIYQNYKNEFLGSDAYVDLMSKKYIFIEDTSKQFEIIYKRNLKKERYLGYTNYYTNFISPEEANIQEIKKGVYYINLSKMEADTFMHFIQTTPLIEGLILDGRNGIKVENKILTLLTRDTLFRPITYVPKYQEPFKNNMVFDTLNQNSFLIGNSKKYFPLILMIGANNFSNEETFIHLAKQIKQLKLAGNNSGGCNGMVTDYRGIGGFEVRFTGSVVKKNDDTPLYNIGFTPDITVKNRRKDFKNKVDRLLYKCVHEI